VAVDMEALVAVDIIKAAILQANIN